MARQALACAPAQRAVSSTTSYNPVQIYTCNGTGAQQWTIASGNTPQALSEGMDVDGAGTVAQVWQPQSDGALFNPSSGKCLDDPGATTNSSTQL